MPGATVEQLQKIHTAGGKSNCAFYKSDLYEGMERSMRTKLLWSGGLGAKCCAWQKMNTSHHIETLTPV